MKRTTREAMYKLLEENSEWKVLDMASSNAGWKYADVFTDVNDHSEYYKNKYGDKKKFVQCNIEQTNFNNKEFDFVIASHILEHVDNPILFCKELMRVGKRGYIEVPTPLWDNLVDGPEFVQYGHKWWVTFDDNENKIVINKKINIVNRFLSIDEHNKHMMWFRDSIVTQLYWDNTINIEWGDGKYSYNDNRNINTEFDSNKIEDWDGKYMFEFGSIK